MSAIENTIEAIKNNVAEIIIATMLLATQSILGWIKSRKPHKTVTENFANILNEVKIARNDINELKDDVGYCKQELTYNGGGSTKDLTLKNGKDVSECMRQIVDITSNISEIKASQRARAEHFYNMSNDGILIFDVDGKCTFANEAAQMIYGVASEAICDEWLLCISTQTERERIKASWDFAIKNKISFAKDVTFRNKLTKKSIPVFIHAKPTIDDNDKLLFILARLRVKQHAS